MPIYQYQCPQCENIFDKRQGFHDEAKAACPNCAYPEARRKLSLPAIVFKGSGFYVTDTRSGNAAAAKPANGKADSTETATPDSKSTSEGSTTESKPAAESKSSSESKPETKATSKETN